MPTLAGITVSLQSQYDAATIPEEVFLPTSPLPLDSSITSSDLPFSGTPPDLPPHVREISIPALPCSQFWISYTCSPPAGPTFASIPNAAVDAKGAQQIRFYYFKLYHQDRCVLSWGVGEHEKWRGRVMYGLFAAGTDFEGKRIVLKQAFFFPKTCDGGEFEVRVFRAMARKQEGVRYDEWALRHGEGEKGTALELTNIGRAKKADRRLMYSYALIDPKDKPFITFRYHLRSSHPPASEDGNSSGNANDLPTDTIHSSQLRNDVPPLPLTLDPPPRSLRRLSVPPDRKLLPSTTRSEPSSPTKTGPFSSRSAESLPLHGEGEVDSAECKRRDWVMRTPSPMVARLFDRPMGRTVEGQGQVGKMRPGRSFKSVISNVMKGKVQGQKERHW